MKVLKKIVYAICLAVVMITAGFGVVGGIVDSFQYGVAYGVLHCVILVACGVVIWNGARHLVSYFSGGKE